MPDPTISPAARRAEFRRGVPLLLGALALVLSGCGETAPQPPLGSLFIVPVTDTIPVGETRVFTVNAFDEQGQPVSNPVVTWSSSQPLIMTVNTVGRVDAVCEGSAMLFATSGGITDTASISVFTTTGWYVQRSGAGAGEGPLNGIFMHSDGRVGWAVGSGGRAYKTTDAGGTWTLKPTNSSFNLNAVWFTSLTHGWAAGTGGTVLRSTNGGETWTRMNNVGISDNLLDVTFASADTGWAVGSNGAVARTANGGGTWTVFYVSTSFSLRSVAFANSLDGWAVGDNGVVAGTHDSGLTWFVLTPAVTTDALTSVAVRQRAPQAFAAVGNTGRAPRTVPSADSLEWQLENAGAAFALRGVWYPTPAIGYAVGTNGGVGAVLRTDDGGQSWETQVSNSTFPLNDVYFVDALRGWAVGENGIIVHTARGGMP